VACALGENSVNNAALAMAMGRLRLPIILDRSRTWLNNCPWNRLYGGHPRIFTAIAGHYFSLKGDLWLVA